MVKLVVTQRFNRFLRPAFSRLFWTPPSLVPRLPCSHHLSMGTEVVATPRLQFSTKTNSLFEIYDKVRIFLVFIILNLTFYSQHLSPNGHSSFSLQPRICPKTSRPRYRIPTIYLYHVVKMHTFLDPMQWYVSVSELEQI